MNQLEFKSSFEVTDEGHITGTAWPFGTPDRVGDMIEKGAFANSVTPLPMLFSHDANKPVGSWTSISEDGVGLKVEGKLLIDDVPLAREARALVQAGALGGLSIGFQAKEATSRKGGGRNITLVDLFEISLVAVPCHPGSKIATAKSAADSLAVAAAINRAIQRFNLR